MKSKSVRFIFVMVFAVLLAQTGCKDDTPPPDNTTLPTVSTTQVIGIGTNVATGGGTVTDDGGLDVTSRGICWSTTLSPTTDDYTSTSGSGVGEFTCTMEGLSPEETYHVRAFAINSKGTSYGDGTYFTTLTDLPNIPDNNHMLLGNPSSATTDVANANNYLMIKPQYCLSYNNSKLTANWVSWHLYLGDIGGVERQDDFRADNTLPSGWYWVPGSAYSGSGFDRGHMCPSADRTLTIPDNSATFLMTNMIPQAPNNNRVTWANLESYSRNLLDFGNELFIVCGPWGQGGTGSSGYAESIGNDIVVPNVTWKIIVVIPNGNNDLSRISATTRVIAVVMPNAQTCSNKPWTYYRVSVDEIEELTGYDFLSNVPTSIQSIIEARVDDVPVY
jgi:endonuclease G